MGLLHKYTLASTIYWFKKLIFLARQYLFKILLRNDFMF